MLAYHTPTRMKGSAIVQGLRSWASALHPQLPLSRKESQRLLTALTGSFRRQLDEVHPPQGSSDARPQVSKTSDVGIKSERSQGLHSSSAAFADKHLASVLTSPLLAQGRAAKKPDFATVMAQLQKNPAKDPIELLEEYHGKGPGTIPIAVACLESFKKPLEVLPEARRKATIADTVAGKRVLLWIWQNKIYEDEQFVQDRRLSDLVVPLVLEEGFEKYLWEWLELDMPVDYQGGPPESMAPWKAKRRPYRWKGVILRSIVAAKLQNTPSFDAALRALYKALELKDSLVIPLAACRIIMHREIRHDAKRTSLTDVKLYDRFIEFAQADRFGGRDRSVSVYDAAWLHLLHPKHRSPLPALSMLKRIFDSNDQSSEGQALREYITSPVSETAKRQFFYFFVRVALQLEDRNRSDDATWVANTCKTIYPDRAGKFGESVQKERANDIKERQFLPRAPDATPAQEKSDGIAMPGFAI